MGEFSWRTVSRTDCTLNASAMVRVEVSDLWSFALHSNPVSVRGELQQHDHL